MDIDGVADCDGAGLRGLLALCAQTDIAVSVQGARWPQLMDLLSRVPIAEVQRHCDEVRSLVGNTPVPSSRATVE